MVQLVNTFKMAPKTQNSSKWIKELGDSGEISKHYHGVGLGPLSEILAVKTIPPKTTWHNRV